MTLDVIYFALKKEFGNKPFTLEELKKRNILGYDEKSLSVVLNRLREKGLLKIEKDERDLRRSIYRLLSFEEVKSNDRGNLINILKRAAHLVRGKVDYEVLLILLFYKAISDLWKEEFEKVKEELIKEGWSKEEAEEEAKLREYHTIHIPNPEKNLWDEVIKARENLTEKIRDSIRSVGEANPQISDAIERFLRYLDDLIGKEDIDLIIRQVVDIFNKVKFSSIEKDILGDAYEWLINYFAPQKAKAGELFTPREVVRMLIEILDPGKERRKILDPAAGSGGMLIYSYKFVRDKFGEDAAKELILVGQESKDINYAILKLNFLLHGIGLGKNIKLYFEDSLLRPLFKDDAPFDIVIFNPPWNQDGYGEDTLKKSEVWQIFSPTYPPNNSADWAWIKLALHFVSDKGKVGVVIDNGCLFRGGKEKAIRKEILEKDWVECVILLPEKLFYNTGAPGVIIIFNKNKPLERKGKILFINASEYYEKHPEVRKMNILNDEGIRKIVEVYRGWKEIPGFSRIVSLEDVRRNDYNLNVTLYVFPKVESEEIDIKQVWGEMKKVNMELEKIEKKIKCWIEDIMKIT